jgi:hypothetical protein
MLHSGPDGAGWGDSMPAWVRWIGATVLAAPFATAAFAADLAAKAPPQAVAFDPFWVDVEALAWSVRGDHLPPLVTTSPAGTPQALAGVLGNPGTTVLFGDSSANNDWRTGGRITAGYWFDPQRSRGIEASFFDLQNASTGFAANSTAFPILAQPFFDPLANAQAARLIGFPGLISGAIGVDETSHLLGAGALYRQDIGMWGGQRISALIGYRYLHSSDKLSIPVNENAPGFGSFSDTDFFNASSNFHGLDLGLAGEWRNGPWSLEWRGKVALGANINSASINGTTTITPAAGGALTFPAGLFALSSNIGNDSQPRFAAVPELSLKAGYQFAQGWQLIGGYDLLYWTGVQRAGGLIDTTINPNLIPPAATGGPARPMPVFNTTSLLAQGFSFGVRYNY